MSAEIGNAYDFSDIAGNEQVLWVCLSGSLANEQIVNLAPIVSERPVGHAVEVESESGRKAWLIPAITVAVHQHDLDQRSVAAQCKLTPAEVEIESLVAIGDSADKAFDDLQNTAWRISQYFHANPDRQVIPDIKDCLIVEEDSSARSLLFAWRHDQNRRYILRFKGDSDASLQQQYDPRGALRWPADAPLEVGPTTIKFAADGSTVDELSITDINGIRAALGSKTETGTREALRPRDSSPSDMLGWLFGNWRAATAAALVAGIVSVVILLPQTQAPTFDVYRAYATTDVRGGARVEPGIILELIAENIPETTNYFAETLRDAGIAATVEPLPGDGMLVTGNGRIGASDRLRDLLTAQDIDVEGREYIEIVIQPSQ